MQDLTTAKQRLSKAHKPFIRKEIVEDIKLYLLGAVLFIVAWVFIIGIMNLTA